MQSHGHLVFRILHENKFDAVTLFFDRHPKTGKPFIKYKSKRKNGFRDYGKYMEEKIRHLIKLRREEGLEENGFRDLYCLIVYCAYLSSGTAEEIAWEKTMALNESFQHPLLEKELRNYMSSATEKKYRFTFEKVIEYLDIDKKEQETIHLKPAGVRKKEHEMAKKRAEENRRRRKEDFLIKILFAYLFLYYTKEYMLSLFCDDSEAMPICMGSDTANLVRNEVTRS